jgi:hypothetical protein
LVDAAARKEPLASLPREARNSWGYKHLDLTSAKDAPAIETMDGIDQPAPPPATTLNESPSPHAIELGVTLNLADGIWLFEWSRPGDTKPVASGTLGPVLDREVFRFLALRFMFEPAGIGPSDNCGGDPSSVHALLRRLRKQAPPVSTVRVGVLANFDLGPAKAGKWHLIVRMPPEEGWKWLGQVILRYLRLLEPLLEPAKSTGKTAARAGDALHIIAAALVGAAPTALAKTKVRARRPSSAPALLDLRMTFNLVEYRTEFEWCQAIDGATVATGTVDLTGFRQLSWKLTVDDRDEPSEKSQADRDGVREVLDRWFQRFPADHSRVTILWKKPQSGTDEPRWEQEPPFRANESPAAFIEENIVAMAEAQAYRNSPLGRMTEKLRAEDKVAYESHMQRLQRKELKRTAEEAKRKKMIAQLAEQRRQREEKLAQQRAATEARKTSDAKHTAATLGAPRLRAPLPPVPVVVRLPTIQFQDTAIPLADLDGFALRERAALWWVSNQSDDLLCLPHCRIQRLDYQLRTALRVLGALRGRALLSDEVGLGKTIEAGLITKELFTRGMVKRFLVLTLPSLIDQWAEELEDKFGLATVTTNQPAARSDPARFWQENAGIVASLHTLKQPAQLEIARQVHWDMLIVDEAHYLRNRTSQAWQAVNALPRQFLLLLTATPVQNSLEELYNLVTLLQPGQLPSPKEFRARFLDPQRPRQPREPEELRRLLGQVMIRNTRANAGIELPPRRAETVVFSPEPAEAEFWNVWEGEFRARLEALSASQASLWGRLLLQAAGSSPAAWRSALAKFPDRTAAQGWGERAPLEASWRRKCDLLLPLTRGENGAVIFTQFLDTQAAVADFLRGAGVPTFVINGSTPAPERQPITEEFHHRGGALLLTHSGTEGRNLQFCRTLVNFDLPWNPMEIEQRVGRLHRLGQRHSVHICNLVQAGTLQEHLLQVLQEKLNLFELVVGETGLVLGERFSGDEFEEEVFRRWQTSGGQVGAAIAGLGDELAEARGRHAEVKQLDETLFAHDFESL